MTDLIPLDQHELVSRGLSALDLAIAAWLDAKRGRSGSVHTGKIYETTLADFRTELHRRRLDLDSDGRAVGTTRRLCYTVSKHRRMNEWKRIRHTPASW
jgi:hypothetical protein